MAEPNPQPVEVTDHDEGQEPQERQVINGLDKDISDMVHGCPRLFLQVISLTLKGRYNVLFIMFEYVEPRNIDFYRSIIRA